MEAAAGEEAEREDLLNLYKKRWSRKSQSQSRWAHYVVEPRGQTDVTVVSERDILPLEDRKLLPSSPLSSYPYLDNLLYPPPDPKW
eukprot:896016-Amorphochlora_amoeboformis.AAC.1